MVTMENILEAHKRIGQYIHETPVVTCSTLDRIVNRKVFFKCENFQKTGSFKARGALNAVLKLENRGTDAAGVVTHSSGNHGQALAWAAQTAGLSCSVIVPNNTPKVKVNAIEDYGAEVVLCEPTPKSREATCSRIAAERSQIFISAFDHLDVISGQGTIAVEFLEQCPHLDAILVPISGGGMTSGIAIATKSIRPETKIFAVEPKGKDLGPCLEAGERPGSNPQKFVDTIADGIRTYEIGHMTFPILCQYAEKQVFTVSNEEMVKAMKFTMQRMKVVIEASSAAGVAAVMSDAMEKLDPAIKNIGVILCGGNVDIENLPW